MTERQSLLCSSPINLTGLTGFTGLRIYNNMIYCVNPVQPVQKKKGDIELIGDERGEAGWGEGIKRVNGAKQAAKPLILIAPTLTQCC